MKRRAFLGFLLAAPVAGPVVAKAISKDAAAPVRPKPRVGARRVVFGKMSDGSYGMAVSKPGFDVLSSADGEMVISFRDDLVVDGSINAETLKVDSLTPITADLGYHTPGVLKA
jgi:hypothetical protein